jgi:Leucine-rich repeat (LRR) protein
MGWLTGDSLRYVGEMTALKELSVTEARDFAGPAALLKREDLQPLAALPLTKLDLDFNQFRSGECELTPVGQMHDLRELIIRNKRLTRQEVTALQQLSALDDLTLLDCELEDAEDGAILFQGLVKLRHLFVDLGSLSSSTGRAISEIRGLESLVVHNSKSFDDDATWISQIKSLRGLNHLGDNASNSGIAKLGQLPHLKFLALWSDRVKDDAIDSFVEMKALKRLDLNCHHISPAGKKRLENERPDLKVSFGNCN